MGREVAEVDDQVEAAAEAVDLQPVLGDVVAVATLPTRRRRRRETPLEVARHRLSVARPIHQFTLFQPRRGPLFQSPDRGKRGNWNNTLA